MPDRVEELDERIEGLIRGHQYALAQSDKDALLAPILRRESAPGTIQLSREEIVLRRGRGDERIPRAQLDLAWVAPALLGWCVQAVVGRRQLSVEVASRAQAQYFDAEREQPEVDLVELDHGRQEPEQAVQAFVFQAPVLEQMHDRGQRQQAEHAVAEHGQRGVQLDPGIVAKDLLAADEVPGRHQERHQGQGARVTGGEQAEQAHPERRADEEIDHHGRPGDELDDLFGQAAVANSKVAYAHYKRIFEGGEFEEFRNLGARVQRPLWASTSTKNPEYSPTLYVDTLIGPNTVNTVPPQTLDAIRQGATVAQTVDQGLDAACLVLERLQRAGIDMKAVTDQLIVDGVKSFADSFGKLLGDIERVCEAVGQAA